MVFDAVSQHTSGVLSLETFKKRTGNMTDRVFACAGDTSTHQVLSFPEPLPTLDIAEKVLINEALRRAGGNKSLAAHMIGLTRQTFNNRLKKSTPDDCFYYSSFHIPQSPLL